MKEFTSLLAPALIAFFLLLKELNDNLSSRESSSIKKYIPRSVGLVAALLVFAVTAINILFYFIEQPSIKSYGNFVSAGFDERKSKPHECEFVLSWDFLKDKKFDNASIFIGTLGSDGNLYPAHTFNTPMVPRFQDYFLRIKASEATQDIVRIIIFAVDNTTISQMNEQEYGVCFKQTLYKWDEFLRIFIESNVAIEDSFVKISPRELLSERFGIPYDQTNENHLD
ncbi:hypothetical protein [Desulfoplanes sp.]